MTSLPGVPVTVAAAETMVAARPLQVELGVAADALVGAKTANVDATRELAAMLVHRENRLLIIVTLGSKGSCFHSERGRRIVWFFGKKCREPRPGTKASSRRRNFSIYCLFDYRYNSNSLQ